MGRQDSTATPTLNDAVVAAQAGVDAVAGETLVNQVRVYGSLATGDAKAGSDIDMVVLVAGGLRESRSRLTRVFSEAAYQSVGMVCDVHMRLSVQWEHLTANVLSSFDASIAEVGTLRVYPDGDYQEDVLEGTLEGMPTDDTDEGIRHGEVAAVRLMGLCDAIEAFGKPELVPDGHQPDTPQERLLHDCHRILAESCLVMERAVRCLGCIAGRSWLGKNHDLSEMAAKIGSRSTPQAKQVTRTVDLILDLLRYDDGSVKNWGVAHCFGTEPEGDEAYTVQSAMTHCTTTLKLVHETIRVLTENANERSDPTAELLSKRVVQVEKALAGWDGYEFSTV